MIEFPFRTRLSKTFGEIFVPKIPITLKHASKQWKVSALLDSGADFSIIPFNIGEFLGFEMDLSKRTKVEGIGKGSEACIITEVNLNLKEISLPIRVGWAMTDDTDPVLGRLDVFEKLDIEFQQSKNKILI